MANLSKPGALSVGGAPAIPAALASDVGPYLEARNALVAGWRASDDSLLILTRFAATPQLHAVSFPLGARRQLSFEADRIAAAAASPTDEVLVVQADVGGSEFFQLYTLANGRLSLVTDGESRNLFGAFSPDGRLVGYSSSRRNGVASDLYVVDPRDPATDRRVLEVEAGGWAVLDFMPDNRLRWSCITSSPLPGACSTCSTSRAANSRRSPTRRRRSPGEWRGRRPTGPFGRYAMPSPTC